MGKTVVRNSTLKILGTLASGAGDNLLTINSGSKDVTSVPSTGAALSNVLTSGHIFVGNASNVATDVALTGMIAISNAGVSSIVSNSIQNVHINSSANIAVSKLAAGSNGQVLTTVGTTPTWVNTSNGTVTTISSGNLNPIFTTSISNPTTTPAISFVLTNAAQNTVLAGPTSGAGAPTYRSIVDADITALNWSKIIATPTTVAGYGIIDAQPILVSGTNIKTINGSSVLGSGNLVVSATLTNGSGTTANGTAVDLGGTLTATTLIDPNGNDFNFGTVSNGLSGSWYVSNWNINTYLTGGQMNIASGAGTTDGYIKFVGNNYRNGFVVGTQNAAISGSTEMGYGIYTGGLGGDLIERMFFKDNGIVRLTLGSDATGDLFYRNSSGNLTRLPIGSTSQVLTVNAGLPSWQPSAGGGTVTSVTLTQPAAGFTITNSGVAQSPTATGTFALANDLAALEGLASTGIAVRTATDTWAQRTITGTTNQIDVTNGNGVSGNPTLTISATYVGQTSITTLGTIATGTWNATTISAAKGGTGQTTYAIGDILYADTTSTLAKLADVAAGSYLRSGGVTTAPVWSTLILPNAATANQLAFASATNTLGFSSGITYNGTTFAVTGQITDTMVNGGGSSNFLATRTGTFTGSGNSVGYVATGSFTYGATASDITYINRVNNTATTGAATQVLNADYYDLSFVANHTGSILRGFYWNPTISGTQTASLVHYGLTIGSGQSIFGAIAPTNNVAVLVDMISTTRGFSPPKMTTTQRDAISTPFEGLLVFNTTTHTLNQHNGTSWVAVGGAGGITNTAANTELMMSDGTNAIPSGVFATASTGSLTLGSASITGNRSISVASSSTTATLTLTSKNADITLDGGNSGSNLNVYTGQLILGSTSHTGTSRIISAASSGGNTDLALFPAGTGIISLVHGTSSVGVVIAVQTGTGNALLSSGSGSPLVIHGFDGSSTQPTTLRGGNGVGTNISGAHVFISGGTPTGTGTKGNISLHDLTGSFGSAAGVTYVGNRTVAPSSNPADGFILYSEDLSASAKPKIRDEAGNDGYIPVVLYGSATLDFPSTSVSSSSDLTITVTGAAVGDLAVVTPPNASVIANSFYTCWVSATNTVTVRFSNLDTTSAANPASGTFKALVFKNS
jgi:hypothetical protein